MLLEPIQELEHTRIRYTLMGCQVDILQTKLRS
jgi:hypothetical protein